MLHTHRNISPQVRTGSVIGLLLVVLLAISFPADSMANPVYAAVTMDARDGKVIHSRNADKPLHPASLTKMMTLYIVFEAIESGKIDVDQKVRISANAAREPSSKVYLKAGSRYSIRYLIRAAAIRSANDAATALAEAISGSESAFIARMNKVATAMGMRNTVFRNAHGLTEMGHFSTARDMAKLGRRLIFDYPGYYNIFSRRSTMIGSREIYNTNRAFLNSVRGADGIKTGYTRAAGYNQVVSAKRGDVRLIVSMFGGKTASDRNTRVAKLLEQGFNIATPHVTLKKPRMPLEYDNSTELTQLVKLGPTTRRPDSLNGTAGASDQDHAEKILAELNNRSEEPTAEGSSQVSDLPEISAVVTVQDEPEVDERLQPAGISLGQFGTMNDLLKRSTRAKIISPGTLLAARQVVINETYAFHLKFVGMNAAEAEESCKKIRHRRLACDVFLVE